GNRTRAAGAGGLRPAVLLHVGRRLRRPRDPDQRGQPPRRPRSTRDHRSRHRARLPAGGAGRARLRLVRLPPRVRPRRAAPRLQQAARQARRSRSAAGAPMKTIKPFADDHARQAIVNELDDTLVVEAAAGTGKTTELVKRIVRILATERATVDAMCAVTFTEKAAGELKLRLRQALDEARMQAPEKERDALNLALQSLEEAHVSTIHGFCAELLRERPVEARVDPLFSVLTESQAERLFEQAFSGWIQKQLRNPPEG